jgi:hypothetical protein
VSDNLFILIQSFENTFIGFIVLYFIYKIKLFRGDFSEFLIIYFITGMVTYGIVVTNYGTMSRYKYTFVLIFVVFSIRLLADRKITLMKKYEKN